jgi:predicted O-methyltransferase YrrM
MTISSPESTLQRAEGEDEVAARITALRGRLSASGESISIPDLKQANVRGGGTALKGDTRTITVPMTRMVDRASSNEWSGRVLYRCARGRRSAIEVGANVGLGSVWIAAALEPPQRLILLDGAGSLLRVADEHVQEIAGFSCELREGLFGETVPALADELTDDSVDFVFIDGEHFYEPTIRDANLIIPKVRENGIVVFDDISWNDDMERAWSDLAKRADCRLAIEPRHRGARRLGVFVKGSGGDGRIRVVDDALGPASVWGFARRVRRRIVRLVPR